MASARELAHDLLGEAPPEPEAHAQVRAGKSAAADLVARTLG
jgi:hypothetical protein